MTAPGRIVILNGAPRSGKSSIASVIQETFDGVWMNLGVDAFKAMTPPRYQPGIGLRPGGERPDLEPLVAVLYRAMYEAIAAHSRLGVDVVVDIDHHDGYSRPRGILPSCARQLADLTVWFVGVRCPVEVVVARRRATWGEALARPREVLRWEQAVHTPGVYDLEVDTSVLTPEQCAGSIRERIEHGPPPSAFRQLSGRASGEDGASP